MVNTLVVVADSGRARIYRLGKKGLPMEELADLVHTPARMKGRELISDRPGRTIDSKGRGRHAKEDSTSLKTREATKFAKQITAYIERARNDLAFTELALVAAPEFLGILRSNLGAISAKLVSREIDKDLVLKSEAEVRAYLAP